MIYFAVPEVVENFTTVSQSPHSIRVSWPPPYPPNGPPDKIVFYVKWSTQSAEGISQNFISDRITLDAFNPFMGMFEKDIHQLSQDQTYTVRVCIHSNPLNNSIILDSSNLKEFADDSFKFDENGGKFS